MARWRVIALRSEPAPGSPQARFLAPNSKYLWQEHYGTQRYEEAKKDQWKWETTCQQRPEEALPQRFERKWIQVYVDRINPGRFHVWLIVDPALSKHKNADRTSIMALAGLRQQRIALVDWVLDRLDPDERTRAIVKMANHWDAEAIMYEETGMVSDTFYLNRDIDAYGLNCPIIPVGRAGVRHNLPKESRILRLIPTFREGRIVLPGVQTPEGPKPRFVYRQLNGQVVDLMAYFIESEYVRWAGKNSLEHDEGLDTLSRVHDDEFQMTYAEDDVSDTEEQEQQSRDDVRRLMGEGQYEGMARGQGTWFGRY